MSTNDQSIGEIDGYDYAPESSGGRYLRLKNKGDSAVFRIVSNPCRFYASIQDRDTGEKIRKERFGWIVAHIEKVTGADGKPTTKTTLKGFEAGIAIYLEIRKYAQDDDYGDPRNYNFKITRTEAAGKYYDVMVPPKSIGQPIEGLAEMLAESGLTLQELFLNQKPAAPGSSEPADGYDPFSDE